MITERIALVMLKGEFQNNANDPHFTRQFYKSIQDFAEASMKLCDEQKFKKLQEFLGVAYRLFRDGNETVKNAIVNIYLFTLSRSLDEHPEIKKSIEPFMPRELRSEYARLHYASGI